MVITKHTNRIVHKLNGGITIATGGDSIIYEVTCPVRFCFCENDDGNIVLDKINIVARNGIITVDELELLKELTNQPTDIKIDFE